MPATSLPSHVPVLIAGGGPVGLTLAALLARQGIASLVIEADEGYCSGSRAICVARRSQEILAWAGAADALVARGLPWTGGRSYWRDTEVLHFGMPTEPTQRFAPMLNIQQFHVEELVHRAARCEPPLADVRWGSRVEAVDHDQSGARVQVRSADGTRTVRCDYLVACDGGRSTVREQLG
ncbi:MAG: monooxygenase, FAD-binding protein, partial [Ramlibacter sp.]|nr:monooxygenase, FAD-binding protein [Ramlibacter sp.]